MSVTTRGHTYAKLSHYLIECQNQAAMLSHLHRTEDSPKDLAMARAWLQVSEQFKIMRKTLAELAAGKLQ